MKKYIKMSSVILIFSRKQDLTLYSNYTCLKCQNLFSLKNKKKLISKCSLLNVLPCRQRGTISVLYLTQVTSKGKGMGFLNLYHFHGKFSKRTN